MEVGKSVRFETFARRIKIWSFRFPVRQAPESTDTSFTEAYSLRAEWCIYSTAESSGIHYSKLLLIVLATPFKYHRVLSLLPAVVAVVFRVVIKIFWIFPLISALALTFTHVAFIVFVALFKFLRFLFNLTFYVIAFD